MQLVDEFTSDGDICVFLLATRVACMGLNLQAASRVVFLEHDWNPNVDQQVVTKKEEMIEG